MGATMSITDGRCSVREYGSVPKHDSHKRQVLLYCVQRVTRTAGLPMRDRCHSKSCYTIDLDNALSISPKSSYHYTRMACGHGIDLLQCRGNDTPTVGSLQGSILASRYLVLCNDSQQRACEQTIWASEGAA